MPRFFSLCSLVVGVLLAAGGTGVGKQQKADEITGSWKLVSTTLSGKPIDPDTALGKTLKGTVKVVTASEIVWSTADEKGKITRGAWGRYTLKGNDLTITTDRVVGGPFEPTVGDKKVYNVQIKDGKWYHTAKLENGELSNLQEVWERVEKK
ncbi:MAG: hypothetical protein K2V38_15100 [Gemmataceae bacterium]|nr:hypothetical protein [Gemmataceae bacterium]